MKKNAHICVLRNVDSDFGKLPPTAPFFKKLKRNLLLSSLISHKNPRSQLYFRTNTAIRIERKRHANSPQSFIIHPFSAFRTHWEMFMMVVFFVYLTLVPLIVAYFGVDSTNTFLIVSSYVACFLDFICISDIVLTFYTGYTIDHLKQIVLEPQKIALNYLLGSYFILDFFSSMPTELVVHLVTALRGTTSFLLYVNLIALLKVFRIRTLLVYMNRAAELWHMNQYLFIAIKYMVLVYMLIHWTACFQYIIPKYLYLVSNDISDQSWVLKFGVKNMTILYKYQMCIFKAEAQLLSIQISRFNPITIEDILTNIAVTFIGYIMCGLALVVYLQIFFRAHISDIKYHSIMNQLKQYMRHKQLPINMQKRLVDYYNYRFRKSYFRENTIFPILSVRLRQDINYYTCNQLIKKVAIFKDLSDTAIANLITGLRAEVFLPNDIVVKAGTPGDCMYFIRSGTVAVYTPTGKEVCHLQDGAYFGEMGLIAKDQKRIANVLSLEICEVFRLDRRSFNKHIRTNPDLYKKFERVAERRRENTLVMEEIHRKHILEKTMRMMDDR